MKKITVILSIALLGFGCKPTFNIQGKKLKTSVVCNDCRPGNLGPYMKMTKKTYDPIIDDNSTPEIIAHNILGHVFPENIKTGNLKFPCSSDTKNPFTEQQVKRLGSTGNKGQSINYSEKEFLKLDIDLTVESDLNKIRIANPSLNTDIIESFKAKLYAAYLKFANKELKIEGRYHQFELDQNAVIKIARNLEYSDCRNSIYNLENPKRLITAIGIVYFDITINENSVDEIASTLETDAKSLGINFNIGVSFKRNISNELEKVTKNYFQVVVWRTVGISDLNKYKN
ncbi:hypothetical protein [Runella sp. SP2]|uniref:hypothetical protein n=1 Tax=Runella sp. SP2 TaxID=2268026 RepID=UPI000F0926F1|nr:hypothetical protein [Runella sp. SP2]AYQ32045.1 hypothetical protein DTQ70_07600 [Runella sp. SP2]